MSLLNHRLAAQLQSSTEVQFYPDRANYILRTEGAKDGYGQPAYTETRIPLDCAFTDKPHQHLWKEADIEIISAEIRLSATKPQKGGRFEITHRFGAPVDDPVQQYEIVDLRERGTFGYVVALAAVKT